MDNILMEIVKDKVDEKVNAKEQQVIVTCLRNIMDSLGVSIEKAMDTVKNPAPKGTGLEISGYVRRQIAREPWGSGS